MEVSIVAGQNLAIAGQQLVVVITAYKFDQLDSDSMRRHSSIHGFVVGFRPSAMFGFWFFVVISWFFAIAYTGRAWQLLLFPHLVTRQADTH
eukprot:scaffold39174_cov30-Prasinocladus_malaysianus.AAC.2